MPSPSRTGNRTSGLLTALTTCGDAALLTPRPGGHLFGRYRRTGAGSVMRGRGHRTGSALLSPLFPLSSDSAQAP